MGQIKISAWTLEGLRRAMQSARQTARQAVTPRAGLSFRQFADKLKSGTIGNNGDVKIVRRALTAAGFGDRKDGLRFMGRINDLVSPTEYHRSAVGVGANKTHYTKNPNPTFKPSFAWRRMALDADRRMADASGALDGQPRSVALNARTKLFVGAPGFDTANRETSGFDRNNMLDIFLSSKYLQKARDGKVLVDHDAALPYELMTRFKQPNQWVWPRRMYRQLTSRMPFKYVDSYGPQAVRQAEGAVDDVGGFVVWPESPGANYYDRKPNNGYVFVTNRTGRPFTQAVQAMDKQISYQKLNEWKKAQRNAVGDFGKHVIRDAAGNYDDQATIQAIMNIQGLKPGHVAYDPSTDVLNIAGIPFSKQDRQILAANGTGRASKHSVLSQFIEDEDSYW